MPIDNVATTLITHGSVLASLLREFETKQITTVDIHEKARYATVQLLDELKGDSGFPAEEPVAKILRKIEWCLGEFTKHDSKNASNYKELTTRVGELISVGQSRIIRGEGLQDVYNTSATTVSNNTRLDGSNLDAAYDNLLYGDKLLVHLLCLLPGNAAIKKQELLHWCVTLSYIIKRWTESDIDGNKYKYYNCKLTEFVEKGIIVVVAPVITIRAHQKLRLKYKLHDVMRAKIIASSKHGQNVNYRSSRFGGIYSTTESNKSGVLNVNQHMLDYKNYDWIFRMEKVSFVHLGDWNDDPTRYIVVQDVDAMAKLLIYHASELNYLSLQGVSGIVELPRVFYGLLNLRILNLRGCHNLESLPDGIEGLKSLMVLDVSECYLLNHIPKGIRKLYDIYVFKGFIIPQDEGPSLSKALLSDLSMCARLTKLTLRTRRLNFPTNHDLQILCDLKRLTTLKVTWVGATSSNHHAEFDDTSEFPGTVEKFEIEAASKKTTTRLLELIARQNRTSLKKLYIRGGDLSELVPNIKCKVLRLQYLPSLSVDCYQMIRTFPKLQRLEMSSDVISSLLRRSFKIATGSLE